jgi:amino acid transporter
MLKAAAVGGSAGGMEPPRALGLRGALSANILNMVGVGPFITIPLALSSMGGPQALLGWLLGAVLCMYDGLIWAELGSALPRSGGPYHYLREAFGADRLGKLFGFLFLWQTLLTGPLSIASGTVGFAQYTTYLFPSLSPWMLTAVAVGLCLINTALLYRDVRSIGRLSIAVTVIVIGACLWIILSGAFRFDPARAFAFPPHAFALDHGFWVGLGAATLIGVYDYGGYNNVCMLGGEIRSPSRTIPRAVLLSIPLVAVLYLALNLSILGVLPWQQAAKSPAVVAEFMETIYGRAGGVIVAVLVLLASWGSALAMLLGYSRVPYAAAAEGQFFRPFAKLDAKGGFPALSLLFMGVASAIACLVSLESLIAILIVIQTMFQYTAQCIAVVMLRRRGATTPGAFRMPLYPLPVVVTLIGWFYIVATGRPAFILAGVAMLAAGTLIFLLLARRERSWPFAR